jgi:hypothetical protein
MTELHVAGGKSLPAHYFSSGRQAAAWRHSSPGGRSILTEISAVRSIHPKLNQQNDDVKSEKQPVDYLVAMVDKKQRAKNTKEEAKQI